MDIRLSPIQQQVVDHDDGALLVLAGPGSGKTRVLTERVRRLIATSQDHFRILALTFTNKAANEMSERLTEFPDIQRRAYIGTIHGFCREVLSRHGTTVGVDDSPHVFEAMQDRVQILLDAARTDPILSDAIRGQDVSPAQVVRRWLDAISAAKSQLQSPDQIADEMTRRAYDAYDQSLHANGAVDFDDLLFLTYRLFTERPPVADFYRRQYQYICVDEAQDMNAAQFHLIAALCGDSYKNVMMVGDPRQAIFAWNGADTKFLDEFVRHFDARVIEMTDNFRSCVEVVKAAQALYPMYSVEGQLPIAGTVTLFAATDESAEGEHVCSFLERLLRDGHPDIEGPVTLDRCAVIGRTRFALSATEDAIRSRQWSYFKQLSSQYESESDVVREFEVGLRILSNPRDQLHLRWLLDRWGLEDFDPPSSAEDTLAKLAVAATTDSRRSVIEALKKVGSASAARLSDALGAMEAFGNTLTMLEERALLLQDVGVWRDRWDEFLRRSSGGDRSLGAFLSDVALGATQRSSEDGIAMLTVHSAKGLEFDVVAVVGLADGVFPDYRAQGSQLDEERRNAFVAITRAKRVLALTYPKSRMMPWGEPRAQRPSEFFSTIQTALTHV